MLHLEGDQNFAQPPADVWAKLSDARFLVQCIPGIESVSRSEQQTAVCVLRPGFAFVRGTLEVTIQVTEAVPAELIRIDLYSKGIGSSSQVLAALDLVPQAEGSRVHWTADVTELGGLLKAVPQGLLKASAQKVISDVWSAVQIKVQAG
jgi:carbon monoxide dehydrogenase subunit G